MVLLKQLQNWFKRNQKERNDIQGKCSTSGQDAASPFALTFEEIKVLEEISRTISASLVLEQTLRDILTSARRLIDFDMAEITLWDPARRCLVSRGSLDAEAYHAEVGTIYRLDEGYSGWLARHRQPLLIPDIATRHDVRPKLDRPDFPFRSFLGIPLSGPEGFIGTLELISYRPYAFSERDLLLLQRIGEHAALAIEHARLYEETRRRALELSTLARVATTIISTLDLHQVLETIAFSVLEVTGCDASAIFVLDEEARVLRLAATRGLSPEYIRRSQTLPVEIGGRGHAVAIGQTVIVEDLNADPAMRRIAPLAQEEGFVAFADIPMRVGERTIGMLVTFFAQPHYFTESERELLTTFADQAAIAIENARLYAQTEYHLHQQQIALSGLQRVARELSRTFDQEYILRLVLEESVRIARAPRGAILLRNESTGTWHLLFCTGYLEEEQAVLRRALQHPETEEVLTELERAAQPLYIPGTAKTVLGQGDIRSIFLAPIRLGESLVGAIALFSHQPDAFGPEVRQFVETLASQAAIAIGNARWHQEQQERASFLHRRTDQLSRVLEVSRAFRSDRPVGEVLEEIAYAVQESVGFNKVLISVLEGDPPYLRRVAAAGTPLAAWENLKRVRQPWKTVEAILDDRFRVGRSYYIPAEEQTHWRGRVDVYEEHLDAAPRQPGRWHPQDLLIVPLIGPSGQVQGILSVDEPRDGRAPDYPTIEALEIFASQAAVVVENARLLEDLQRRLDILATFNDLNRAVTAQLDLESTLQAVVDAAARLLQAQGSVVFLKNSQTQRYEVYAAYGHDLTQLRDCSFAPGEGVVGEVAQSGIPLALTDAAQAGSACYIQEGAVALAPLTFGNEVVGVLTADRRGDGGVVHPFSTADLATLTALADQVAIAVQNARLYEEAVNRSQELSILLEAANALSFTLDLDWVLYALGERLMALTGADECVISEWNRETDEIIVVWDTREDAAPFACMLYKASDRPLIREVLLTQEPMVLAPENPDARPILGERSSSLLLLLPMVTRGQTLGLVELERRSPGRSFSPEEIRLAQALANQAAAAVQNARLFEEVRRFTEELEQRVEERTRELAQALQDLRAERDRIEALYRIASQVSASLDIGQVLHRTLETVAQVTGADQGYILLLDSRTDTLVRRAAVGISTPLPVTGLPTRFHRGEGLAGWVLQHRQAALIPDLSADPRWVPGPESAHQKSGLAVPIGVAGEILGVLLLFSTRPNFFTEDHLRLVEAAAAQIANAVNNATLYDLIRQQAEDLGAMLRQQQIEAAKMQAILEGVADGVLFADASGQIVLFNAAAERILEIPRREALGRSIREMLGLYGVEGRKWLATVEEWAAHPADRTPEDFIAERLQLGDRVVSVHASPVIRGKEYLGTVSVFRDITAEVEADRAKSEFISTVSHELRTPMTSIKGYADLLVLGMAGPLNEQQKHFINIIRNNAERMVALVNDLLDISRIESGRLQLDLRALHIREVVDQVVTALQPRAQNKNLTLTANVPTDLPPVWGDPNRVAQILTNLISNAIQYTPPGGRVTVSAQTNGDMLEISVADTGIGISKEDQKKIFDRFFRANDPLVQETPGTGLGLPITASLVQMHGGQIWVESELGEGSTFTFTLPLAATRPLPPPAAPPRAISVLVVEDDPDIANLLRIYLERDGHRVLIAHRGEEALRLAREVHPGLITLDIMLPDIDGFTLLDQLKKDHRTADIPVVVISVVPDREKGFQLGALDYLNKPIEEDRLLEVVRRVLHRRGLILVVDDDRDNLSLMREVLRRHGFSVQTTGQGKRALQIARETHPALILLDLKLRDVDGYQVLRNLKSDPRTRDIPVIIMSGSLTDEELKRQRAFAMGAVQFLTKPFNIEDFIREIAALVEKPKSEGAIQRN
ncbi:MAG: GAF domain-containing protein [Anaerolineae bacterium]|nr:GAF domain-containing protein [Anaerolineae bacterium]